MLVLSRRRGQTLKVGQSIVVRVLRIRAGQVQLGIEAPRDQHIARGEHLVEAKAGKAGAA